MIELTGKAGFTSPIVDKTFSKRRNLRVELFATVALAVSLVVAVTAVSIGMARAQALGAGGNSDRAPFAIAVFFGAVMTGIGGLTAIVASERLTPRE